MKLFVDLDWNLGQLLNAKIFKVGQSSMQINTFSDKTLSVIVFK